MTPEQFSVVEKFSEKISVIALLVIAVYFLYNQLQKTRDEDEKRQELCATQIHNSIETLKDEIRGLSHKIDLLETKEDIILGFKNKNDV